MAGVPIAFASNARTRERTWRKKDSSLDGSCQIFAGLKSGFSSQIPGVVRSH
jgi:hypothetical protein